MNGDDIPKGQMAMRPLGNVPLVVIPHGREGVFGLATDKNGRLNAMAGFGAQSNNAKLETAQTSGRSIPLEQPDIVVDAIQETDDHDESSVRGPGLVER